MAEVTDIKGIGSTKAETLSESGYESVEDIANAEVEGLSEVDGVGEERALEFIVGAQNVLEGEEEENEEELSNEEFDLTPADVANELKDGLKKKDADIKTTEETVQWSDDTDDEDESNEIESEEENDEPAVFDVDISFSNRMEYDTFHAALMRYNENIYTSNQSAVDAMEKLISGLNSFESVSYELTEYEMNTLHIAVKQTRTSYKGDNLIDHMDSLLKVEEQIDNARRKHLF